MMTPALLGLDTEESSQVSDVVSSPDESEELFVEPLQVERGRVRVPTGPGLGVRLKT